MQTAVVCTVDNAISMNALIRARSDVGITVGKNEKRRFRFRQEEIHDGGFTVGHFDMVKVGRSR